MDASLKNMLVDKMLQHAHRNIHGEIYIDMHQDGYFTRRRQYRENAVERRRLRQISDEALICEQINLLRNLSDAQRSSLKLECELIKERSSVLNPLSFFMAGFAAFIGVVSYMTAGGTEGTGLNNFLEITIAILLIVMLILIMKICFRELDTGNKQQYGNFLLKCLARLEAETAPAVAASGEPRVRQGASTVHIWRR